MSEPAARRPRVNWFSPLPPARTDIAHYAMRTLPALSRHCDLVVWTNRHYWPREMESFAKVRRWDGQPWVELHDADATLFHIGNNIEFHGWIWEIAQQHPAIVVLHDVRLHEFFASVLLAHDGREADYVAAVQRCHGDAGRFQAERLLAGSVTATELAATMPLTELTLLRSRGAVVHTPAAFRDVSEIDRCPVLQLDLPFAAGAEPHGRPWDGTLRLIVFGYLGPNRRLNQLLQAIASYGRRDHLELDIFGELRDTEATTAHIRELGLSDRVRVHGFVRESELDAALDRAHLAVNLRYPTMGEASGSQLRIWSRGLASVVTRTGWYAELSGETVWFVDPENEIADLQDCFDRALANPAALQEMGTAGRRYLIDRHDPARYAEQLVDGIERMMRTPASIVEPLTATVSAALTQSRMAGEVQAVLARRAAGEIARWIGS